MQEAQKLEHLGQMAGGIAHDFNNPLTTVLGNASLLKRASEDSGYCQLTAIEKASMQAAGCVSRCWPMPPGRTCFAGGPERRIDPRLLASSAGKTSRSS